MARPKKEFDWSKLDAILQYNAELNDAAEIMQVHPDTIAKKIRKQFDLSFSEYRHKKMGKVRIKLVQKATEMAFNGNATMMIFCLKNLCKWVDRQDVEHSGESTIKIETVEEDL